jgi:hypothetical protein
LYSFLYRHSTRSPKTQGTISAQKISNGVDGDKTRGGRGLQERGLKFQALENRRKKARSIDRAFVDFLERETRFELATSTLAK